MVLDYEDYRRERDLAHYEEWYLRVAHGTPDRAKEDWEDCADIHFHCFTPTNFLELVSVATRYVTWSTSTFFLPGKLKTMPSILNSTLYLANNAP